MNYLAIDTSGKHLTVAIKYNGAIKSFFTENCGVDHSSSLMPTVEGLLAEIGAKLSDMDFFACVVGAGSFTGIRIGVATVKALCFAYNKPCLSITSFDTLAYNKNDGKILAVIDAKHNGFYVCGYQDGTVVLEPSYLMRPEVELLKSEYQFVAIAEINGFDISVVSVAKGLERAINAKLSEVTFDIESLTPLYVRKSQAEEGR